VSSATWTVDELDRIGAAEELELAALRRDGTPHNPVTIWVVCHGDDLYVRTYRGRGGSWFRDTQNSHEGHISAGGVDKDVLLIEVEHVNEIDAAYRTEYCRYAAYIIYAITSAQARAATLRLVPRST
jgi:hypothetical protein